MTGGGGEGRSNHHPSLPDTTRTDDRAGQVNLNELRRQLARARYAADFAMRTAKAKCDEPTMAHAKDAVDAIDDARTTLGRIELLATQGRLWA